MDGEDFCLCTQSVRLFIRVVWGGGVRSYLPRIRTFPFLIFLNLFLNLYAMGDYAP